MEVWITVGKPVSIREKIVYAESIRKPVPEVCSLILHVIHSDFMLVKYEALPSHRNENIAFLPYSSLSLCFKRQKFTRNIQPTICLDRIYIQQGNGTGSLRNRHCSAPHAAGAWGATAEKWSAARTCMGNFRLWVPVTASQETIKLTP